MTASKVFSGTMRFMWLKLLLGITTVVISAILFAILVGIGSLFGEGGTGITIIIWLIVTGIVHFALMHYVGYLIKAGHIAVIATAVTTGKIPDNQVEVGKKMVAERFATSNIYFAVDKLVGGAVKQLQGVLDTVGNIFGAVPGVDAVMKVGKLFISISLGYIDECCLGYTFVKKDQGAFKSAADGVVIYAQNWKKLLKDAAVTTGVVIAATVGITLVAFLVFGLLFRALHWSGFVAFLLAAFVAFAIKFAFIDSWILVKMMVSYMEVAPSTVITFDLYGKLSGLSAKFKELFEKGRNDQPQPAYAAAGTAGADGRGAEAAAPAGQASAAVPAGQANVSQAAVHAAAPASAGDERPVYCGQCGEKNSAGSRFCIKCGAGLN